VHVHDRTVRTWLSAPDKSKGTDSLIVPMTTEDRVASE